MAKLTQSCPWCKKDVVVESERSRLYACPFCKNNFTFTPSAIQTENKTGTPPVEMGMAPSSRFVETPFLKELVDRTLA